MALSTSSPHGVIRPGISDKSEIQRFAPFIRPQIAALYEDTSEIYAITDIISTVHPLTTVLANSFTITLQRLLDLPPLTLRFTYSHLFPEREPDIEIEDDDVFSQALVERASDYANGPRWISGYRQEDPKSLSRLIERFRRARANCQLSDFREASPTLCAALRRLMDAPFPGSSSKTIGDRSDFELEDGKNLTLYVDVSRIQEAYVEIKTRGGHDTAEDVSFGLRLSALFVNHLLEEEREILTNCLRECNNQFKEDWLRATSTLNGCFRRLEDNVETRVQYRMQFVNVFVSENTAVSWDTNWFDWVIVNFGPVGSRDIARTSYYVSLPHVATTAKCIAIAIGRPTSSVVFEGEEFINLESAQARANYVLNRLNGPLI